MCVPFAGVLLGWRCPVCGATGAVPCAACAARMRTAGRVPRIVGLDWCGALLEYRGAGRELVARAKYRNQRAGLLWLAAGMADLVASSGPAFDVITWAPANPAHVRSRGFDHGQLLARTVGGHLGAAAVELLERGRGAPLTGRSASERQSGPPLRPVRAGRAYPLVGATVLVVDDVITTGATLAAASRTLRAIGAAAVIAVAAAYTPIRRTALSPGGAEGVRCR